MFKNVYVNRCQRRGGGFAVGEGRCCEKLISTPLSVFGVKDLLCTRQTSPFIHAKANLDPMHGGTSKVDSGVFRVIVVCGWGVDSVETTAVIGGVYSLYCLGLPHRRLFNMPMPRGLGGASSLSPDTAIKHTCLHFRMWDAIETQNGFGNYSHTLLTP